MGALLILSPSLLPPLISSFAPVPEMALVLNSSLPLPVQCSLFPNESRSPPFLHHAVARQNRRRARAAPSRAQSQLTDERTPGGSAQRETPVAYVSALPSNGSGSAAEKRVAIVWFKKDLRVDDHPGLLAASSYGSVVPCYIFDPDILVGWSLHLLEALLEAVMDLKDVLQRLGSDLVIRRGRSSNELLTLAKEWYHMLAMISVGEGARKERSVRYWRWRGFLIQYNTSGSEGPPIVLVHGFGVFGDHYRGNIKVLAEKGNRVWALTMLGFGRSEKPNVLYTGLLWAELLRDFILVVVREPAILVGNSIGGYMACSVAGLWPSVVKSLVLLNTAGIIIPEYQSLKYQKPREKSTLTWVAGRILLFFLRISVGGLLKKCYPMRPWRVDKWLYGEVMRASYDPGAVAVLESLFHLGQPLPVNYFIDRYNDKVLVVEGVRDPLNLFTDRGEILQSCCPNVTAKYMDAGHCPHDEFPDEVNILIFEWIQNM